MILGNPYKFAVLVEPIKDWNIDDTFCNGLLLLCVNGSIYPKEIETATLRYEVELLKQNLSNLTTDCRIFALPPQQAFAEMYCITFPEDIDIENNYRFHISPASLSDHNCFLFAVCDGVNVRILASKLNYEAKNGRHDLQDITVNEAFVSVGEWKDIIAGLNRFSLS